MRPMLERRIGCTIETKEYTLRVDHLEQEILLSIRLMPRIDSGSRCETHEEAQPTAIQTNRSRQMMPWSGRSRGSPAKKAGKLWRNRSHFSESHHSRSKGERVTVEISESRPRPCRMAHRWVSKKWLKATCRGSRGTGSNGAKHLLCGYVAKAVRL